MITNLHAYASWVALAFNNQSQSIGNTYNLEPLSTLAALLLLLRVHGYGCAGTLVTGTRALRTSFGLLRVLSTYRV
jgi:hypothetical protein